MTLSWLPDNKDTPCLNTLCAVVTGEKRRKLPVKTCGNYCWIYLVWDTCSKTNILKLASELLLFHLGLAAQLLIVQKDKQYNVLAKSPRFSTQKSCLLLKHWWCYKVLKKNN